MLRRAFIDSHKIKTGAPRIAQDIIKTQSEIRENIRQLTEEWRELDSIYRIEARKKRSKFTAEELDSQRITVLNLSQEITKVKEIQRSGYAKGTLDSASFRSAASREIVSMEVSRSSDCKLFVLCRLPFVDVTSFCCVEGPPFTIE